MKCTHVPGRVQPWDEFHESPYIQISGFLIEINFLQYFYTSGEKIFGYE
jgi:hypothetical protein